MAAADGRSLEETPTWAVAVVCFVLVAISIIIEHIIHLLGKPLFATTASHVRPLADSWRAYCPSPSRENDATTIAQFFA
ncbi:hypothetical protein PHJA_000491300 [Phtheirospermum japonicum]|uniref:Uncharacterized protein n=1 Tax=Phtheirospermum japonicum TaxID=374723 RepID=A0A830BDZ3_9LAMI|nr:hypothetical protein PHJA_000491300 [Phtheirospermum japonicum]